ncbi:MAG TPA: hypothetical protein VGV87_27945 [Blastocatellia bacterium]|nr:hypothetical protein [Blastocatellia bacterium]
MKRIVTMILLLGCFGTEAIAQRREYLRIKETAVVRFDLECAKPTSFPKAKLGRLVRTLLGPDTGEPGQWGDRAFSYDLNGDQAPEYFVPLQCGATGNCEWAVFALKPTRVLGVVFAENLYVHRRVLRWSRLTASEHETVSESILATYHYRGTRYRRFGAPYEASAYRDNFPRFLLRVEPLCNPHYVPGSIRPR